MGPTAVGIIQGILPAVALAILIALVPIIFTVLSTMEGIPQQSFVQLSVLHKFFFFQLIDVVLVSTLSGGFMTIVSELSLLAQNPFMIINILSTELPKASTFFITFVMLQSTNQSGQAMLQLIPFILSYVFPIFYTTPRDIYTAKKTCPNVNLGTLIPAQTIIFVLGLEYGVIAPLILPFVWLFFALQYFVYLYQFLYVYEIPFETAGRAFPRAIRHIYIGLIISQLTLVGLFAIRSGARGQLALMVVDLIFTCFALYYYDRAFKPLFKYLPVSAFEHIAIQHKKTDAFTPADKIDPEHEHHDMDKKQPNYDDDSDSSKNSASNKIDPSHEVHHVEQPRIVKMATNSSENSRTSVEAYTARAELLGRLHGLQGKDVEEIKQQSPRVIAAAKSLYEAESYMHPSTYAPKPTIWIPEDEYGITQKEIKDYKADHIDATSYGATIVRNAKSKPVINIDEERLLEEGPPGGNPSAANQSNVNNYVRTLVDSMNFAAAISAPMN